MFDVIHQLIRLDELFKLMETFFQICFRINGQKVPKNIQMNSEAQILIKVQCVIYQWIRLDEFCKLMESFLAENRKIFIEWQSLGLFRRGGEGICAD